jgi:hypothetical protein
MTVQPAVKCNDTEEVPVCVLSNGVPQQDEVQQLPWPPPELEVLCSNDVHSRQLTNAGFEVPPCLQVACNRGLDLSLIVQ